MEPIIYKTKKILELIFKKERLPIFIHIPRTGGTAIKDRIKTSKDCTFDLHRSIGDFGLETDGSNAFAIVRNPFDRLVSAYFFLKKGGIARFNDKEKYDCWIKKYGDDFKSFVINGLGVDSEKDLILKEVIHLVPQVEFLRSDDKKIRVKNIGRFEHLQQSFKSACDMFGINYSPLILINSSEHEDYKKYYDEEMIKIVSRIYKEDLDLFGYHFYSYDDVASVNI